jgi:phospholipid transport system substrate-binding protein
MDIGEHVEIRQLRAAGKPLIGQKAPPAWARKLATMFVAASLALPILARPASVLAADPEDSVRNLYDALLGTMKEGRVLGESGRYARIDPVIHRLFDIPFMVRLAVGTSWATLSPAQQQQVTAAFGRFISATYADRFDSYSGQQLEVTGRQSAGSSVIVKTRILKAGGEAVNVEYLTRQNGGAWQITDVYLDGSISQLATQRSEFGAILRREGFDGLIAMLHRKVDMLTGNMARAF